MKINLYSTNAPAGRVQGTMENTENAIKNEVKGMNDITWKIRRFTLNALAEFPEGFNDRWNKQRKEEGLTDDQIFDQFLNGKGITTPETLAKPYIKTLGNLFKRANKKKRNVTVISFRHGHKDNNGNLSEIGEKKSQELGQELGQELKNKSKLSKILENEGDSKNLENEGDKEWDVILAATHNVINETIINTIFSDEKLPENWKKLLDFTETVTYTFYPNEKNEDESYLEVDWRHTKRQITYKKFKELMEKIGL